MDNKQIENVFRRQPENEREAEIMKDALSVERTGVVYQIEDGIKSLREDKKTEDKIKKYNFIASRIESFLKTANINQFSRKFILSFFDVGDYPTTTKNRHIKQILNALFKRAVIEDGTTERTAKQQRFYSLSSNDEQSYFAMMKNNGFTKVNYFKWYCDSDGIPRRRKVGTSNLNGLPVDKDGEPVEEYDLSVLKQTIPRHKMGVNGFVNKSLAFEQRRYNVKCFNVIA